MGYWNVGIVEYWNTGILEYWNTGILEDYLFSIIPSFHHSNKIAHGSDDTGK
jgi:hypothetical protein